MSIIWDKPRIGIGVLIPQVKIVKRDLCVCSRCQELVMERAEGGLATECGHDVSFRGHALCFLCARRDNRCRVCGASLAESDEPDCASNANDKKRRRRKRREKAREKEATKEVARAKWMRRRADSGKTPPVRPRHYCRR